MRKDFVEIPKGTKFLVVGDVDQDFVPQGTVVTLRFDDRSTLPAFNIPAEVKGDGTGWVYLDLEDLKKIPEDLL